MLCEIHRREYSVFGDCPQCQETERLRKADQKFIADLDNKKRKQDQEREEELQEERERRHQELLERQREHDEAQERRHEEIAEIAREKARTEEARAEADAEWRRAQRAQQELEQYQRQIREGLPSFDDAFRAQWLAVNEAIDEEQAAEDKRQDRRERAARIANERYVQRRNGIDELLVHLIGQPINALVVTPPAAARAAWQDFMRAYGRIASSIGLTDPGWQVEVSRPNLMAPWHLMRRVALASPTQSTKAVREHGLVATVPELPKRLSIPLLGCGALVLAQMSLAMVAGTIALTQMNQRGLLLDGMMVFVAAPLVMILLWRLYASMFLPRSVHRIICDLQVSIAKLVSALRPGSVQSPNVIDRGKLFSSSEWTIHSAFMPLLTELEKYLVETVDAWQIKGDEMSKRWADQIRQATLGMNKAIKEKDELDRYSDPPEVRALKERFAHMEGEIRRVGRQIIAGLRVRSATIRLMQCPSCGGPVSSETSSCPYCGSGLQYA